MKTENESKKCEICGEMKPLADFSKSYKNRCKACVAAETRMNRESARNEKSQSIPEIDWEKRRYETATAALVAILSSFHLTDCYDDGIMTSAAHDAVIASNALISELQKVNQQ